MLKDPGLSKLNVLSRIHRLGLELPSFLDRMEVLLKLAAVRG